MIANEKQSVINSVKYITLGISANFVIAEPISEYYALYAISDDGKYSEKFVAKYGFWDNLNGMTTRFKLKYDLHQTELSAVFLVFISDFLY